MRLRQTNPEKPRLLLITLEGISIKRSILKQATKLRNSSKWNEVFISPDLTPKERETNKKLREELRNQKQAGEKNLIIRCGKIVVDTRRSDSNQPRTASDQSPGTNWLSSGFTKVPENLRIFYTNCDQLSNKFDELLLTVENEKPDLILLTEVLSKSCSIFAKFIIPGFLLFNNFVSDFTPNTSKIRGISVYVRDSLQCSQISFHSDLIENLWIEIRLQQSKSLLVGCIDRSPSLPKFDSTEDLCKFIKSVCDTKPHHILIVGDFNYSNINWEDYTASGVGSNDQMFIDTLQECVSHQHITEPTRYRQG